MESANLHHQHQLQDQLVGSSSSSSSPSSYGTTNFQGFTQNTITLSSGNLGPNYHGVTLNPRQKYNSSMVQGSSFHWNNNGGIFNNQHAYNLQLPKIKGELTGSFPRFTEASVDSPSSTVEDSNPSFTNYVKNEQKDLDDLSSKLLLKTISSGFPINSSGEFYIQNSSMFNSGVPNRRKFSQIQIHPSINISKLNQPSSSISGSFDMNSQASDFLSSTTCGGGFGQPSNDILGMYKDNFSFSLNQMQQSNQRPSYSPSKIIASFNNSDQTPEAKRPNRLMEPKATQAAAKKSRISCPPLKVRKRVRKEKLGDRIAALQQLVAPFGKTDTASVLMEAIGYIKFLQNQVETLSVPYMKATRNKTSRAVEGVHDENEETKRDLRSRGLCVVPLSCMSYVTNDVVGGAGGMWPPPDFGGGGT